MKKIHQEALERIVYHELNIRLALLNDRGFKSGDLSIQIDECGRLLHIRYKNLYYWIKRAWCMDTMLMMIKRLFI